MKSRHALLLFFLTFSTSGAAAPFEQGSAQAGKLLFEQKDCNSCHIAKMGGNGSAIFTRPNRIVNNPDELLARMKVCSGAVGATLSKQDEQDLGAWLNQTYYQFK